MSYRCELESNWPCLCREEQLNRDRNGRYDQKVDPGGFAYSTRAKDVGDRQILQAVQKCHVASLLLREQLRAVWRS